jgi:AraC family transcriptional regulator, transcriptional activator of pobA
MPPVYQLYGENPKAAGLDGLHLESIASRSRLHNWEILPHRHAHLVQLLLVQRGPATVQLDAEHRVLRGPALVWVPALAVHGFRFGEATQGLVLTLEYTRVIRLLAGAPDLLDNLRGPRAQPLEARSPLTRSLLAVAEQLHQDYFGTPPWRSLALDHAVGLLLTHAARVQPQRAPREEGRGLQHLARYREQVERRYREQPSVAALAQPLGITPTQLNRLCRKHFGCSALAVLHHRLLLEAQRELGYTHLQVRQISDGLGFSDPAYFTRFFARSTGLSPSEWRVRHSGG